MSALIKAIIATAEEIGQLTKDEWNPHSSYNYVGIDTFYERVAPVARKHGIVWTIGETDPPTLIDGGKHPVVIFHFEVVLRCVGDDGQDGVISETMPMRISVPHNWQGAQTAGSASSYAVKTILRAVFAVRTGEKDADAEASFEPRGVPQAPRAPAVEVPPPRQAAAPAARPPQAAGASLTMADLEPILKDWFEGSLPVFLDPGGDPAYPWDLARDAMLDNIPSLSDNDRLVGWWRANISVMEQMKKFDPASHGAVVKAFEQQRGKLKK